jgi:hypothetical protein
MRSTTTRFAIARHQGSLDDHAPAAEPPPSDVQRGVTCMGAGGIGVVTAIGGLYLGTNGLAQAGALGLLVLSLLLCEFAYNALWVPTPDRR